MRGDTVKEQKKLFESHEQPEERNYYHCSGSLTKEPTFKKNIAIKKKKSLSEFPSYAQEVGNKDIPELIKMLKSESCPPVLGFKIPWSQELMKNFTSLLQHIGKNNKLLLCIDDIKETEIANILHNLSSFHKFYSQNLMLYLNVYSYQQTPENLVGPLKKMMRYGNCPSYLRIYFPQINQTAIQNVRLLNALLEAGFSSVNITGERELAIEITPLGLVFDDKNKLHQKNLKTNSSENFKCRLFGKSDKKVELEKTTTTCFSRLPSIRKRK